MLIGKIKKSERDLIALETMRIRSRNDAESRVDDKPLEIVRVPSADVPVRNSGEGDGSAREFTSNKRLYGLGDNFDCLA